MENVKWEVIFHEKLFSNQELAFYANDGTLMTSRVLSAFRVGFSFPFVLSPPII